MRAMLGSDRASSLDPASGQLLSPHLVLNQGPRGKSGF